MNKFFLKLFNKKKYLDYKNRLQEIKNFDLYNKIVIPDIKKITLALATKKKINFLHSGHLGDVVNSMPIIKEISINSVCNLYLETDKKIPEEFFYNDHPFGNNYLTKGATKKLIPLLEKQNYISRVKKFEGEEIDINLNLFRKWPINFNIDSIRWYFHLTGKHADLINPYIIVEPHNKIINRIVIMRSLRRQNKLISYEFLNKYENPLFVGLYKEYESLKKIIKNLDHYECDDFLELASIIKSAKVFIGNPSFGYALAESIKVKRLLESAPNFPLVYPNGKNAYDFYFQSHFESLFEKLYKS
jgi:hypothetical protein